MMDTTEFNLKSIPQITIQIATLAFIGCIVFIIWSANTRQDFAFLHFSDAFPYADKLAHFLLIGGATWLLNMSLKQRKIKIFSRNWLLGSVIIFVIITLEEFSQLFIHGRTFDLLDLAANYAGIFCFGLLLPKRR